jgi:endonuclease-3
MNQDTQNLAALLLEIHSRLCRLYGCPVAYFGSRDPLSQLVSSLLSQRTVNKNKSIAFKSLREAFPTWENVRDAPVEAIQEAIRVCTWPEQKAPRLKALLHEITARTGGLSLDFLANMEVQAARDWLQQLHGIGPKASAAVMSFNAIRAKAMPVDAHHYRVAARLGLIEPAVTVAKAHEVLEALLPADWTAQDYYDHHEAMMFHGQRCCYFKTPDCGRCVLLELCPTGQTRVSMTKAEIIETEY